MSKRRGAFVLACVVAVSAGLIPLATSYLGLELAGARSRVNVVPSVGNPRLGPSPSAGPVGSRTPSASPKPKPSRSRPAGAPTVAKDACPPYPAFPDAGCTGPTRALTAYAGPLDFRTPGQVIENVEIRTDRGLYIPADNVTFHNVRVIYTGKRGADFTMALLNNNSGTVFDHCEFDGRDNVERAISGTGTNVTVRNSRIHHTANGIEVNSPLVVEGNYIHDIHTPAGEEWHADGIQVPYGSDNITIRHNTVILTGSETGAISAEGTGADPASNVLIERNLFAGGGWTLYLGPGGGDYQVRNNHFSTQVWKRVGYFGVWYNLANITRSGNVIHQTGIPANDNNW